MKSRSSGSKGSRDNSVENDSEPINPAGLQGIESVQSLTSSTVPETPSSESNCLAIRDETSIPSSPPPSYEHVLEETRLEQNEDSREDEDEEEEEEEEEEEDQRRPDRVVNGGQAGGGGERVPAKGPEILHKSSKEFYRAVAKQWGITCKMSDHCRCLDCQSHYFDCEYEREENGKTDGGLGAGTPMFISEVMHGTACALL
ncbi:uncharacterized protein [Prorops nasuta]|uniref:uncharacterized protein n=1 Tax=Prorops nasuta TaxID=863751 RepID=UPI0034CD6ED2